MAARLAGASLVPLDLTAHGTETLRHLDSLDRRARELGVEIDLAPVRSAAERYLEAAEASQTLVRQAVSRGALSSQTLKSVNGLLVVFERLWLAPEGLAGRPWYRHLFASSDPTSGYSAWMLPEIRGAIEEQDADAARAAVERAAAQLRLMTDAMRSLRAIAASAAGSEESGG
jgi:N-acetylated-alpha-linked acidic dipeptidase